MAQKKIDIKDFQGLFTYADKEDIDPKFMTALENLYPRNGRLIKTFGIGAKLTAATAEEVHNFGTFIESRLTGGALDGELYVGAWILAISGVVTIYGWDGSAWDTIGNITDVTWAGTFYHALDRNPIVQIGDIIRFLPGAVSVNVQEAKGIWLGYIDRDFFDGIYLTPGDYTAAFFNYATNMDAPDVSIVTNNLESDGSFNPDGAGEIRNYRFSYIYDGNQESLLSDPYSINFTEDTYAELLFSITMASHNKRITAMNVYRSQPNQDGPPYNLIETIDFLRESGKAISGTADGYSGLSWVYLPDNTWSFNQTYDYKISMGGDVAQAIVTPTPTGTFLVFEKSIGYWNTETYWDSAWEIWESTTGPGGGYLKKEFGSTGGYGGLNTVIVGEDTGKYTYSGGVVGVDVGGGVFNNGLITSNYKLALLLTGGISGILGTAMDWFAVKPVVGLYLPTENGAAVDYKFWDTGISGEGAEHPLWNEKGKEKYIKINARFAKHINGRLWQGDIVIDPGGIGEVHTDWGSYSEIGQADVNPASNVIKFADREGGAITGLHEMFGNPVYLKKQAIITLNVKTYPNEPARWNYIESPHNIGNLANFGSIKVRDSVYVCYYDGIYRISPNNLAASDGTPTEKLRITEAISDVYLALSNDEIADIQSAYEPVNAEIIFDLNGAVYAFNTVSNAWRKIDSGVTINLMDYDENAKVMVYQTSDKKVYSFAVDESVDIKLRSKIFDLTDEDDRKACVRTIEVNYKSATALALNIYADAPDGKMSGTNTSIGVYGVNNLPPPKTIMTSAGHGLSVGNSVTIAGSEDAYFDGSFVVKAVTEDTYTIEKLYAVKTAGTWTRDADATVALPAQAAPANYDYAVRLQARKILIEIDDAANSTTDTEIYQIKAYYGDYSAP